jgi:hypothetical protein
VGRGRLMCSFVVPAGLVVGIVLPQRWDLLFWTRGRGKSPTKWVGLSGLRCTIFSSGGLLLPSFAAEERGRGSSQVRSCIRGWEGFGLTVGNGRPNGS